MAFINFQPKDYFNTKLYTGNGGNQTITGVGFQPDWVWFKSRDAGNSHAFVDIVRGTNKVLYSDSTSSEQPISAQTFNSDGFALVQDGGANSINSNGSTKVAWSWKAGGGQGSSNTDGSINTTYTSVNTTSGFSISTYTGTGANATVGHGLGVAPKIVLVKDLSSAGAWRMYTEMTGNESQLALDQTSAADSGNTSMWNSTSPTTTTFSIGTHGNVNTSSNNYVAYCFAEKKGFSKFGSYTGNGNADGSFIYTGFRSAMIIFKQSSASGEKWYIYDNKRNPFNITNSVLFPSASDAESSATTGAPIDILSNGFKLRGTDAAGNGSGSTYIYMAFSDQSIVSSNGVPAVAR